MVSNAFNSLTHRPTGQDTDLAQRNCRGSLFSTAHSLHYPPAPAVNSSKLTASFLLVNSGTHIFKKNDDSKKHDCSKRMHKLVLTPSNATLPILLKTKKHCLLKNIERLFCNFQNNFWWERLLVWKRLPLVRTMAKHVLKHGQWERWVTQLTHFPSENV